MCNVFFREQIVELKTQIFGDGKATEVFSNIGNLLRAEDDDDEIEPTESPENSDFSTPSSEFILTGELLPNLEPTPTIEPERTQDEDAIVTFDYIDAKIEGEAVETSLSGTLTADNEILAYEDGVVIADGDSGIYGKYLIVYHGDITYQYFNCGTLLVGSGDEIVKGQVIARIE